VDSAGSAYVTGATASLNFPLFGGTRDDAGTGIAVDSLQNIYIAGTTNSPGLPLPGGQSYGGGTDVFAFKMGATGPIMQGSYLGAAGTDIMTGMGWDPAGTMFITGSTTSTANFVTGNAFQGMFGGGNVDAFVAAFNFNIDVNALNVAPVQLSFQGAVGAAIS
jgi:hypothetical protein